MKKILALILALAMVVGLVACGSNKTPSDSASTANPSTLESSHAEPAEPAEPADPVAPAAPSTERKGGKILFCSSMTDGPQYEAYVTYLDEILGKMGYTWELVIGDPSNDPAGNLAAVQNAMTNDVVGFITAQDGGLAEIMAEYPDMYVAGFMTDLAGVFGEGGTSASCLNNDHFLGTVGDQYISGSDLGKLYFDIVVEKGYRKVSTVTFPPFAYPNLMVADTTFRSLVEEYNKTASDPIEIVGDVEVLMFAPLSDAYFMDATHQDLDAIVAPIAGCSFVYPAMKAAMDAGTISANTKLLTSGFDSDDSLLADFGGDGVVQTIVIGGVESLIWPVVMLDNAIQGKLPADYAGPEQVDSAIFLIDSREDMDKVMSSSLLYTADASNIVADWSTVQGFLTTYNENASYAELKDYLASDALTIDGLK